MSARLAGASVTRDRALNTCEPSCVAGAAMPFFIPMVHSPLEAVGCVAAPEPISSGWRDPELRNTWQRRSSPLWEAEPGAHLGRKVRSGAARHMAAPEPTYAGRCGLKLQLMWQCVDARSAPCLNLELVCGVLGLQGADNVADDIEKMSLIVDVSC
jgi:hypothetical protein